MPSLPHTHPTIIALGYSEAAMFLSHPEGTRVNAIISIHGDREHPVEAQVPHRLDLDFDDIDAPDPSDPFASYHAICQGRRDAENGLHRHPPAEEDAREIIQFATSIKDLGDIVLCHCTGGISRSPAAALICLATWTGAGHEQYCIDYLRKIRPTALPHPDLIRFADSLLSRQGRLLAAGSKSP